MNQQIFDQLIGAPPPSTVDVGAIIVRQRRRQRWRRLAAGGSAAAGVAVAVILGTGLAGGQRQQNGPPPATASPSVTAAPSPSATVFPLETGTPAGRERTKDRLQAAVESALTEHAPGAKWIYMVDVPGEKRTPDGHITMWTTENPVYFEGRSGITARGRKGGFYLSVRPVACGVEGSCSPVFTCEDIASGCTEGRTPEGLEVVRWVEKPSGKYVFYHVQILLRGGTHMLTLQAVNYFGGDAGPISAAAPPLTRTQLERMAAGVAERIAG